MTEPNEETEEFKCFHLQVDCHFFEYDLYFQQLRVCTSDSVEFKDCFITCTACEREKLLIKLTND